MKKPNYEDWNAVTRQLRLVLREVDKLLCLILLSFFSIKSLGMRVANEEVKECNLQMRGVSAMRQSCYPELANIGW